MPELPDAPDGWHWGIGESSESYYTRWLYTNGVLYRNEDDRGSHFGAEIKVYWDEGGEHHVMLVPLVKVRPDGDNEYGYEEKVGSFETEEEALEAAVEKAADLR